MGGADKMFDFKWTKPIGKFFHDPLKFMGPVHPVDLARDSVRGTIGMTTPSGEKAKEAERRIARQSELGRRKKVAEAAATRVRNTGSVLGAGGPQPAASRTSLLGGA